MDRIKKSAHGLACLLTINLCAACTSTQNTSGEAHLPAGETTGFRIVSSDFRMGFSHNTNTAPSNNEETPLFAVRLLSNSMSNTVRINFDNEDCDPFISYSVGINHSSGISYDYFDNVIPLDSNIEIQVTKNGNGKQILLINDRSMPLDTKRRYSKVAIDADGDHTLSFSGLKPQKIHKEK